MDSVAMSDVFNLQKIRHFAPTSWYTSALSALFMGGFTQAWKCAFFLVSVNKMLPFFRTTCETFYSIQTCETPSKAQQKRSVRSKKVH